MLSPTGDRGLESGFLQQRVRSEPGRRRGKRSLTRVHVALDHRVPDRGDFLALDRSSCRCHRAVGCRRHPVVAASGVIGERGARICPARTGQSLRLDQAAAERLPSSADDRDHRQRDADGFSHLPAVSVAIKGAELSGIGSVSNSRRSWTGSKTVTAVARSPSASCRRRFGGSRATPPFSACQRVGSFDGLKKGSSAGMEEQAVGNGLTLSPALPLACLALCLPPGAMEFQTTRPDAGRRLQQCRAHLAGCQSR
jgi:hypothetical protein